MYNYCTLIEEKIMENIYIALILLFATFVQGFTSFGFSLVAIPLLAFFLDAREIVVMTMSYSFVINSIVIRKYYKHAKLSKISPLLITAIIFTFVGAYFLGDINDFGLKLIISVLLIIVGITNGLGVRFKMKKPENFYIPVGIISGTLNGISGVSGPPVLIFLSNIDLAKNEFKATLSSYFFTLNIVAISLYVFIGYYTWDLFKMILALVPFVIIGASLGVFASTKVNDVTFKKVINAAIPIMGITMLIRLFIG